MGVAHPDTGKGIEGEPEHKDDDVSSAKNEDRLAHDSGHTSESLINRTSCVKAILVLFLIQITFRVVLPSIDTFIDLGDGVSSHILRIYGLVGIGDASKGEDVAHGENVVCCPGAGFPGFWFSLGRLHALECDNRNRLLSFSSYTTSSPSSTSSKPSYGFDPLNATLVMPRWRSESRFHCRTRDDPIRYECFSAGCLGVVATLLQKSLEQVLDLALSTQTLWRRGELQRFEVVEHFVDGLLDLRAGDSKALSGSNNQNDLTGDLLNRIRVITTARQWGDGRSILKHVSRVAGDKRQLKELLIQTTWIPYVTGNGLWRQNAANEEEYHMDGGFSSASHPRCKRKLGLPLRADLFLNALSPDLDGWKAQELYEMGYDHEIAKVYNK
eukprot:GHVN01098666.1.p1 GENE.GHVN01098666.1~~GHVN01098666.1.p1  ORF type:complete len:384 (+),score=32.52 GHVN01098666.1:217-1368(+)